MKIVLFVVSICLSFYFNLVYGFGGVIFCRPNCTIMLCIILYFYFFYRLLILIYINFPDIYNNGGSGVLGCIRTTDLMPIFSVRNVCKVIIKGEVLKLKRKFGNQNVSKFGKKLKNQHWNNVFSEECVQTAFSEFMKIVTSSFNECCPLEKVKINYKNRHDWVTKELKADIKKERRNV